MTHMTSMAVSSALLGSMMAITLTRSVRYFIRTPDGRLHQEAKWLFQGELIHIGATKEGYYPQKVEVVPFVRFGHIYYAILRELVTQDVIERVRLIGELDRQGNPEQKGEYPWMR